MCGPCGVHVRCSGGDAIGGGLEYSAQERRKVKCEMFDLLTVLCFPADTVTFVHHQSAIRRGEIAHQSPASQSSRTGFPSGAIGINASATRRLPDPAMAQRTARRLLPRVAAGAAPLAWLINDQHTRCEQASLPRQTTLAKLKSMWTVAPSNEAVGEAKPSSKFDKLKNLYSEKFVKMLDGAVLQQFNIGQ